MHRRAPRIFRFVLAVLSALSLVLFFLTGCAWLVSYIEPHGIEYMSMSGQWTPVYPQSPFYQSGPSGGSVHRWQMRSSEGALTFQECHETFDPGLYMSFSRRPGWGEPAGSSPSTGAPPRRWQFLGFNRVQDVGDLRPTLRCSYRSQSFSVPYWFLALLTAPLCLRVIVALRRHALRWKRKNAGLCPACGYDLRATPSHCPECGAPAARLEQLLR